MVEERIIKNTNIKYILDRDRRRNTYIQIKEGRVVLKVPRSSSTQYINNLLEEKLEWIQSKLEDYETSNRNIKFENNTTIPILGKKVILRINFSYKIKRAKLERKNQNLYITFPAEVEKISEDALKIKVKNLIERYFKSIAMEEVVPAMEDITNKVGLVPNEMYIKNLKSVWGLCSSKKYITINQNLMMFSRHAIEYVCLHEVCHLKHMNHSKEFWKMVEYYMPDYKLAQKELKS